MILLYFFHATVFSKARSLLIRYTKLRICIIIFAPFILKTVFNSHLYGTLSLVMMSNDSYKMLNKCVFCTYGMCACVSVQKFAHHAFLWMDKPPIPPSPQTQLFTKFRKGDFCHFSEHIYNQPPSSFQPPTFLTSLNLNMMALVHDIFHFFPILTLTFEGLCIAKIKIWYFLAPYWKKLNATNLAVIRSTV